MGKLTILDTLEQREYILSHGDLAQLLERGKSGAANKPYFVTDFKQGLFEQRRGTYVLYHKGNCCGQSVNGTLLYQQACGYYGRSNLAVFKVPSKNESLEHAIESVVGDF